MNTVTPKDEEFLYEGHLIISQLDMDGRIIFVNRNFCEVSGYDVDEIIGLEYKTILHPDMPSEIYSKMIKNLKSGQTTNEIIKNIRKDGLYYWTNLEIIATKDEDNNITGFISVSKHASKKDIQKNSELYEKMLKTQKS